MYYNDGTEFPGIGSVPAITRRPIRRWPNAWGADIKAFLEKIPGVKKREDIPHRFADGLRFRPGTAHFPASAEIQDPPDRYKRPSTEGRDRRYRVGKYQGKVFGVFGETVNVLNQYRDRTADGIL